MNLGLPGSRRIVLGAAAAVALWAALRAARPRRMVVTGASMSPTLEPGDRLLVVRTGRPRPGQLVALDDPVGPGRLIVKRVQEAGDGWVEVRGDNPAASTDSRSFGAVPVSSVQGRVVRRYGPPGRRGPVH